MIWYYIILFYFILYYSVLYYIDLYCIVLYYIILYYIILYLILYVFILCPSPFGFSLNMGTKIMDHPMVPPRDQDWGLVGVDFARWRPSCVGWFRNNKKNIVISCYIHRCPFPICWLINRRGCLPPLTPGKWMIDGNYAKPASFFFQKDIIGYILHKA